MSIRIRTYRPGDCAAIAKPFFEHRGYVAVKEQQVERRGVLLTNFVMEKGCLI